MEKLMITAPIIAEDHGDQWSSLSGITFTADEEAEATFMAQLFKTTTTTPSADPNFMASSSHLHNNNLLHFETPSSSSSSSSSAAYALSQLFLFPTTANNNDHYFHYCNNNPVNNIHHFSLGDDQLGNYDNSAGFHLQDDQDSINLEVNESHLLLQPCNSSEAEFIKLPEQAAMEEEEDQGHVNQLEIINVGKKRSRGSGNVQKRGNERSKKTQKLITSSSNNTEEDGNHAGHSRQSTSSYCSEDESANASLELDGGANNSGSNPKGSMKSRASRGSATDPQSLYARRRRERINERLKILQNLVPNGTKVDISTMLEEAVQYVKFLQLQIKLLSSDDLWMYAPIAYNGMDIGLNPITITAKES